MKSLKRFFLTRLFREKLLLLGLVAVGLAIWLSSFSSRAGLLWRDYQQTESTLADQARWIAERPKIEQRRQQAIERLEPTRTFNATRLNGELESIARDLGLAQNFRSEEQRTESTTQFSTHWLRITLSRTNFETLKKFYTELQKRAPYIRIEEMVLQATPPSGELLNSTWRVSSVEVVR